MHAVCIFFGSSLTYRAMLSSVLKVNVHDGNILVFAWVPGPIPSQHLLQDLYPPAHPGPVRQQPQGLHPTRSQTAYCPPQTQQDCYTTTSGRSWSVHLFLLKGVTSKEAKRPKNRENGHVYFIAWWFLVICMHYISVATPARCQSYILVFLG